MRATYKAPREFNTVDFIKESNKIEGIFREPTEAEIEEAQRFIMLNQVTVSDIERFVKVYQPNARMRDKAGLNVRVGSHLPPAGSPKIRKALENILELVNENNTPAYEIHQEYEQLHPFTDCNGRSGRMLWLKCIGGRAPLGFLHHWYYSSLEYYRE